MYLKSLEISGFKSFAKKTTLEFNVPISAIVGPNGSGKSNVAEAFRFVLGEQSIKSMRGKRGEDLIFNGSKTVGRLNRASVKINLDNSRKILPVDYDEVILERVVHRDGVNEYLINGSQVRLRDIMELLSGANIGGTGHHIISQGEADRILNASLKERRSMIEEALGLKIFQYKKQESERKLEKTEENIASVQSLRKEIAPHMKFLKKQMERVEKGKELRAELVRLYKEYFAREESYFNHEKHELREKSKAPKEELAHLEKELSHAKNVLSDSSGKDKKSQEVLDIEVKLRQKREERDSLVRKIGMLEGELMGGERQLKKLLDTAERIEGKTVSLKEIEEFGGTLERQAREGEASENILEMRSMFRKIREAFSHFIARNKNAGIDAVREIREELEKLREEKKKVEDALSEVKASEAGLEEEYAYLKSEIEKAKDSSRDAEKAIFQIMARQNEVLATLGSIHSREEKLSMEEAEFKRDLTEAGIIAGREATHYEVYASHTEERNIQLDRRKAIEKNKIRLEEYGGGGASDVEKEYKEVSERDAFLMREIEDLEHSAASLKVLIQDLEIKLSQEFKNGIEKINTQFQTFFVLMFGGGDASLSVIRERKRKRDLHSLEIDEYENTEDEEGEEGIDIAVSLPHKKTKGLMMLSGGERALTSIALLFAVSQVKPPPFVILDETDAALDEANSKKYGDMIESLSKYSQLILITHNRETMSRAGILYGVTMGSDGISKLLSIQFDEAVHVAK